MIIKRSIVTTFTSCFLINLGALIALVSLLNINLFDFKTTWVILTVSAMLTLLYIVFFWIQYDEQKKGLTQDIEKILNNETPDYEQLQALAKRQEEMSSELQTLSVAKNAEQEAIVEAERIRISRELHDSVSQELFAATMILSSGYFLVISPVALVFRYLFHFLMFVICVFSPFFMFSRLEVH